MISLERSAFFDQSFGGVTGALEAPVFDQSFRAGAVPLRPRGLACVGVFDQSLPFGTSCRFAVERGTSPLGTGAGEGVETVACLVG